MSIEPKGEMKRKLGYFEGSETDKKKYALILEVYYDHLDAALNLIETDPDQINRQDPHSGLTALHIAVFRQNLALVQSLTRHPRTNVQLQDNFNRRAVDMLDYTADQEIFETMMDITYPDEMRELEELASEETASLANVVSIRPKPDIK